MVGEGFGHPLGGGGGGGGGGSLTQLAEVNLGSDGAILFSSIAGTYRDLLVVARVRSAVASVADDLLVRVGNGAVDTGANYEYTSWVIGDGGTRNQVSGAATAFQFHDGSMIGNTGTAGTFSVVQIELLAYADTSQHRQILLTGGGRHTTTVRRSGSLTGSWRNATSAVDTLALLTQSGSNWKAGSKATLYGRG